MCEDGEKGGGHTGLSNPTGDHFAIDYVSHEMGHQFGGYHTMNSSMCSRSSSGQTQVEPASGSSIMGYAGLCLTDVQSNTDPHFNYVNVRDISANIKSGVSTCAAITTTTNNPPVADAGNDYTIPKSTAFILEGTATDADGLGSLTYEWSQNDPEEAWDDEPDPTEVDGPLYRAKMPITSPDRYMPQLTDVIAGNLTPTWEVTPSVGRTMNFSFMIRDNDINGAQTADDLMEVIVADGAGPFKVTSQSTTGIIWTENSTQSITWDVANTTASPVSAANVDIFLSLDGGYTYPTTLASGIPNNGSANIVVPTGSATTKARIMVRGAGNIFYALNSKDFTIDLTTGITNTIENTSIEIYPNPTNSIFTINLGGLKNMEQIVLLDVQGKIIYETTNITEQKIAIDLTDYSDGIYVLKVQVTSALETYKIIKQ